MPSPNLIAAALARRTQNAAICVMGNSLALYNPPVRVAEELAMLDAISGGRLIAGFPVGTPMDTCYAYGMNPSSLRERYHEAHDLIVKAWQTREPFTWNGRFNQLRYVNVWPRPLQQPHPPIWIPGGGSIETWQWCAERNYVYAYLSYFGYLAGEATMKGYWREMDKLGRDRNPFRAGFLQFVGVAPTRQEAMELYREPAEYFYNRCLHVDPRYASPPGYASEATQRARVTSQVVAAAIRSADGSSMVARSFDEIVKRGYVIVGSPDEVAEQLRSVAVNLNVGQLMLLLQFGNMKKDLTMYNTELFARAVRPQIADLFEGEWENHWWPRPLPEAARASVSQPAPVATGTEVVACGVSEPASYPGAGTRATTTPAASDPAGDPRVALGAPAERQVAVGGVPGRVWERGRGATLGVCGGLLGFVEWTPFLDRLAAPRRGVVPSLPGYPGGGGFRQLDDIADWACATLDLLEASGLMGADLVGLGPGATLLLEAAAFCPGAARRLVAVSPFGLFDEADPTADVWAKRTNELPALYSARPEEFAAAVLACPDTKDQAEFAITTTRAMESAARLLWPTGDRGLQKRLHRVRCPTLLVWGERDAVVPPGYAARFARALGGAAEVRAIAGAGHRADFDAPQELARAIVEFCG